MSLMLEVITQQPVRVLIVCNGPVYCLSQPVPWTVRTEFFNVDDITDGPWRVDSWKYASDLSQARKHIFHEGWTHEAGRFWWVAGQHQNAWKCLLSWLGTHLAGLHELDALTAAAIASRMFLVLGKTA